MRYILLALFLVLIVGLAGLLIRAQLLLKESDKLFKAATAYPSVYTLGTSGTPPLVVAVLGDSTAAGVGSGRLEDSYPYLVASQLVRPDKSVEVHIIARSGARIADLTSNQLPKVAAIHPDLVILSIGSNDATHFTAEADFNGNLQKVMATFKQGGYPVLWANTPNVSYIPALPHFVTAQMNKRAQSQNAALLSALPAGGQIHYVDLYNQAALDSSQDASLYASDKFHPSAKGYAIWASVFEKALAQTRLTD